MRPTLREQEALANVLRTGSTSIAGTARTLQRKGWIRYADSRTVLTRRGLAVLREAAAR